jgi:hypothetical protein
MATKIREKLMLDDPTTYAKAIADEVLMTILCRECLIN